jgi:hypothetical protein
MFRSSGARRIAGEVTSPRRSLESSDHAGAGGMLDPGVVDWVTAQRGHK